MSSQVQRKTRLLCALLMLVSFSCSGESGEQATGPIEPNASLSKLGKGLDVTWAEFKQARQSYNATAVRDLKNVGISHVRIRVQDEMSADLLDTLNTQVNDCLAQGLIPIIAYQAHAFENNPDDAELANATNWWGQVASFFKDTSPLLSFDLIVEPSDALNSQPERLNQFYEEAVAAIRRFSPQRLIFIAPRNLADPTNLAELKIPSMSKGFVMAEWHFYAAGPSKTAKRRLWTTGTDSEKQLITDKIQAAQAWSAATGVLTWVGAWMPGNYEEGDTYTIEEQIAFARFMTCQLERASIPFAVNADHRFYDAATNRWNATRFPVLQAILQPACDAL